MIPDPVQSNRIVFIDAPPGKSEKAIAAGVLIAAVAAFAVMTPFAREPLGRSDAFIPAYESALAICDLLTAVLLFGQFARSGMKSLLVLACAYLFNVLMIVPHALSFPGAFGPHGVIGGGDQTTGWLYCFWHGGFALLVFVYAAMADRDAPGSRIRNIFAGVLTGAALTAAAVLALTLLATIGHDLLTPVLQGTDYSMLVSKGISPTISLLSLGAMFLLWRRRNASTLDLWLFVVMAAWLCDVGLSAIVGSSRYDLGWYGGRTFGLLAASFLLVVLLVELNRLYGGLAEALGVAEERNVQLQNSREQLAHAQRLEAMGQLTGGVAHDFNNLLMIVTSSMDIILRSPGNAQKVEKFANAALQACARGQKLTQQLLTFASRQSATPETIDPNRTLSDLETLLQRAIGPGIQIVTDLASSADAILVDKVQFESAILNLVVNARDAMRDGGNVIIRTQNVAVDGPQPGGVAAGRYVKVSVRDVGGGMTEEVRMKAFDPFFTTKEVGSGSGLGLSQVYGFAKSAGGHVEIDSQLGLGTTVTLILPKSTEPLRAERASMPLPIRKAQGTETVLAVEDDPGVLELAVTALEDLGYKVLTAVNASDALKILHHDQKIDLLFSDVIMPGGMNGAQLAVEARRIRPNLKILLTSGYTAEALAEEHGLPDGLEVLPKPYRHEDLAHKIRLVATG